MSFVYITSEDKTIENKKFICIYILNIDKKQVFRIYKTYSQKLSDFLDNLQEFSDISQNIDFVIKNDGRICLDFIF